MFGVRKAAREFVGVLNEVQLENERLKAKNAKLRELVCKVEQYERVGCYECPLADGCTAKTLYHEECEMQLAIVREKRELGIEVEDD